MSSLPSTVNIFVAKSQLSRLVQAVESGEVDEIVIARNGRPAARLAPITPRRAPKRLGLLKGRFRAPTLAEFNADDAAIEAAFAGGRPQRR
jgi:prevent-host-death family protein